MRSEFEGGKGGLREEKGRGWRAKGKEGVSGRVREEADGEGGREGLRKANEKRGNVIEEERCAQRGRVRVKKGVRKRKSERGRVRKSKSVRKSERGRRNAFGM